MEEKQYVELVTKDFVKIQANANDFAQMEIGDEVTVDVYYESKNDIEYEIVTEVFPETVAVLEGNTIKAMGPGEATLLVKLMNEAFDAEKKSMIYTIHVKDKENSGNHLGRKLEELGYQEVVAFYGVFRDENYYQHRVEPKDFDFSMVITDLEEYYSLPAIGYKGEIIEGETRRNKYGAGGTYWFNTSFDENGYPSVLINATNVVLSLVENDFSINKLSNTVSVSDRGFYNQSYNGTYDESIDRYVFDTISGPIYIDPSCQGMIDLLGLVSIGNPSLEHYGDKVEPFTFEWDDQYRPIKITPYKDYGGGPMTLSYDKEGKLSKITSSRQGGSEVVYDYYYNEDNLLEGIVGSEQYSGPGSELVVVSTMQFAYK